MDLSNKELVKSLTSLIDDTLQEIEEIKKSKFAASEIKIEGPGDGLAGKPVNGDLHAKKKEKDEEEDEEEDEKEEVEKAEEACKAEDEDSDDEDKDEDEDEDDKKKKKFDFKDLKKSMASSEELMKSYVDSKFSTFEERLEKMTAALESIANAPVARRSVPAGVQALAKSTETEIQPLNKNDVANKLFELKKSGARVDSSDIFRVETTKDSNELKQIADKYGVK
ncbi:hypothetical protein UFOVP53_49 [uncultured Caudovirales phage]|uniref:Uncharacterized protein n=1 Tax=uncultured Caudovirales phage TaxID=2100421 RepID=A0A6J5KXP4_9CAUD|nr:hypothetical protein UFOVP53_49 [uncultured Caudovirales phage]